MSQLDEFKTDCAVIVTGVGKVSEEGAQAFLTKYPLHFGLPQWLIDGLGQSSRFDGNMAEALEKIYSTASGATALSTALPVLQNIARAPLPSVRRLGASLSGLLLSQNPGLHSEIVPLLLTLTLEDPETSVFAAAMKPLVQFCSQSLPSAQLVLGLSPVSTALGGPDSLARLRALELVLEALHRQPALEAWADSQQLLRPLDDLFPDSAGAGGDVLGLLGALETVKEIVDRADSGSIGARVLSRQGPRLLRCALDPEALTMVRSKAVQLAAVCTVAALSFSAAEAQSGLQIVEAAGSLLLPGHADEEMQSAVADAISDLTAANSAAASAFVLGCPAALRALIASALQLNSSPASSPAAVVKLSCIHSLASLLGTERQLLQPAPGGPFLSSEAESTLRTAVFEVLRELRTTLLDSVQENLRRQATEFHVAGFRLLSALVRRPWGVTELCTNRDFVSRVLDPASETGQQGSEFRYSVVSALAASVLQTTQEENREAYLVLAGLEEAIQHSRKQGPYGRGPGVPSGGSAVPQVLSERRGGGI